MSENIKIWMIIIKWGLYVDVILMGLGMFSVYDKVPGYIFAYSLLAFVMILVLYLILKDKSKSSKIVCIHCGRPIIQIPISPIAFFYGILTNKEIPDKYIWVHYESNSIMCYMTRAEPEVEN